jgi:RNA polymerase sigma factor (sigma-70 family)
MAAMTTQQGAGDGAPPFSEKQAAAIKKIARKHGFSADRREDFVHDVWIEVNECWARVPKVEPDTSRYINGVAANMAYDEVQKRKQDAQAAAKPLSAFKTEPLVREDVAREDAMTLDKLREEAEARNPVAAEMFYRNELDGQSAREIAESAGEPHERVRKRIARMLAWLQERGSMMSLLIICVFASMMAVLRDKPKPGADTAQSAAPETPTPWKQAEELRVEAISACDTKQWDACEKLLDEAQELDPNSQYDGRVNQARTDIDEARTAPKVWLAPDDDGKPHSKR